MDSNQIAPLILGVMMLVFVASGLFARRIPGGQVVRYALAWVGIFGLGYVIFLFRDDVGTLWERARADITGAPSALASGDGIGVAMADDGHFWVEGSTAQGSARMLIDSGATITVIGRATAEQLGVGVDDGLPVMVETANGSIMTQRGRIARLTVGAVVVEDLAVLVSDADEVNVLGMNWLSRMASWQVRGRVMEIRPHERAGP